MTATRTPAQAEAARQNGAKSRGPVTDDGKARASQNARRHGLRGASAVLSPEDRETLAELQDDLAERWQPATAAERHQVALMAQAQLRQQKLEALELRLLDGLVTDEPEPGEAAARLPSLNTLMRYRRQIARDLDAARGELRALINHRLHRGTNEPEPAATPARTPARPVRPFGPYEPDPTLAAIERKLLGTATGLLRHAPPPTSLPPHQPPPSPRT